MPVPTHDPMLLISEWSATLTTRDGLDLHIRPASPEDEATVRTFFAELGPDDLRFRFLSPMPRVSDSLYDTLLRVDHVRTEDFLVFVDDNGRDRMVASAMLSCDPQTRKAEVAISVHPAYRTRASAGACSTSLPATSGSAAWTCCNRSSAPTIVARSRWRRISALRSPSIPGIQHWT